MANREYCPSFFNQKNSSQPNIARARLQALPKSDEIQVFIRDCNNTTRIIDCSRNTTIDELLGKIAEKFAIDKTTVISTFSLFTNGRSISLSKENLSKTITDYYISGHSHIFMHPKLNINDAHWVSSKQPTSFFAQAKAFVGNIVSTALHYSGLRPHN